MFFSVLRLSLLLMLCFSPFSVYAEQWVVLPNSVQPRVSPSLLAEKVKQSLQYPQVVEGSLMPMGEISRQKKHMEWVEITNEGQKAFLPLPVIVRRTAKPREGNLPIGLEVVDKNHPLPLDYKPSDLVDLSAKWNFQANGKFQMRQEAAKAAEKMLADAQQRDGIELRISSAFRSAYQQRSNYLRKIAEAQMDQRVIAKPGHSEHQLGTVLDLSSLDPKTSLKPEFASTKEAIWLKQNCRRYGFVLSYTPENSEAKGYIPEPWHVRYVGLQMARAWR